MITKETGLFTPQELRAVEFMIDKLYNDLGFGLNNLDVPHLAFEAGRTVGRHETLLKLHKHMHILAGEL